MAWNDNLTDGSPAHHIASSLHSRIRVLAGPGAGKSFAMMRRVARLLEVGAIHPSQILAVTFTRVAAEDLQRELARLEVPGAPLLRGKTLHGLAMSILMRNHVLAVLGRHPRPLNDFELEPLLEDLNRVHGRKNERRKLMRAFGAAWARLQTEEPGYTQTAADQAFAEELVNWLTFHRAMLMDEVIPKLLQYLRSNPGARELTEYSHLLIDEYQDLNRAEQEVLQLLGSNGSICIIGDEDQSIYSFRHAHPDGIRQWSTRHETDEHSIEECRRCPVTIVRMANSLISHNINREARLMSERIENGMGEVAVRQFSTIDLETQAVATKIHSLIQSGVAPREIIVLAQRRTFATPIFHQLREFGVPTKSYYAEAALDSIEAEERFSLLKLFLDNEDRVALRWLLGRGHNSWRSKPYRKLMQYVRASHTSPWRALIELSEGRITIQYTATLVTRFNEIRDEIAALNATVSVDEFIQLWLPENENTALLSEVVASCREEVETPRELFEKMYDAISQPEIPMDVTEVRIMSLHKSKGLSSPYVFIVGCVEGLLPAQLGEDATDDERLAKLEEDRRLFYVGISRVKADLVNGRVGYLALTYPQTMLVAEVMSNGITPVRRARGIAFLQSSRFIAEMAPHIPPAQFDTEL